MNLVFHLVTKEKPQERLLEFKSEASNGPELLRLYRYLEKHLPSRLGAIELVCWGALNLTLVVAARKLDKATIAEIKKVVGSAIKWRPPQEDKSSRVD